MTKKILFVNTVIEGGGAAKIARRIFEYANHQADVEAYFAFGRGEAVKQPRVYKFGITFETILHALLVRFLGIDGWGNYFSTKRLVDYIKKNKFDVIHLHNIHGYYLNYRRLFKFLSKINIPVLWTLHDEWILTWLPAHSMGCKHCVTGKGKCVNEYEYPKTYNKFFAGWLLKNKRQAIGQLPILTIISPAEWLARKVVEFFPNLKVQLILNGINSELFAKQDKNTLRKKYGLPLDKKIVLFSSANLNDANKNINYIIKAAREMEKSNYFFVGLGKTDSLAGSDIKCLGYLEDEKEIAEIYLLSDIFCLLSKAETSSLSLLEAQAASLFIIASKLETNEESLKNYLPAVMINVVEMVKLSDVIRRADISSLHSAKVMSADEMSRKYMEVYRSNL